MRNEVSMYVDYLDEDPSSWPQLNTMQSKIDMFGGALLSTVAVPARNIEH